MSGLVVLEFKGQHYTIPEDKAFQAGEALEEVATLTEIYSWQNNPKFFKLAKCYGTLLRFAGCKVSDKEVHGEITSSFATFNKQLNPDMPQEEIVELAKHVFMAQAIKSLVELLMDGAPKDEEGDPPEKTTVS